MLTAYLKRQWKLLLLLAGAVAVFAAVFALYSLPVEAVAYAGLLCLMLGLVLFALGYSAFLRRHRELEGLLRKVHESVLPLPPPRGVLEADYQALLRAVCADRVRLAAENRDRLEDMTDYYTLWAHQIKTPIAAARLLLQEDPGAVGTEVEVELLKIEQYVDMVLGYLRLDSESTDYVLRDTDLDGLLRQAVRGKELTLPVAVDVEENKLKPMSTLDLTNLTAYALEQVERMGFYAQLYTYTHYSNMELDMGRLANRWDVWLSDTTGRTPAVGYHYNAHQHTSEGSVPGISGNVDLNVTTLNYPKIIRKKGLTRLREGA